MDENRPVAFRTALNGFNKQDVNNYIEGMNREFAGRISALQKRITELTNELEEQAAKNAPAKAAAQSEAVIAALNEKLDAAGAENASLREKLAGSEAMAVELRTKLENLSGAADKLDRYDRMSAKMGDLMISAASDADRIRSDAQNAAEETRRLAEERERALRAKEADMALELNERYASAVEALNDKLDELTVRHFGEMTAMLRETAAAMEHMIDEQRALIDEKIKAAAEELPELRHFVRNPEQS